MSCRYSFLWSCHGQLQAICDQSNSVVVLPALVDHRSGTCGILPIPTTMAIRVNYSLWIIVQQMFPEIRKRPRRLSYNPIPLHCTETSDIDINCGALNIAEPSHYALWKVPTFTNEARYRFGLPHRAGTHDLVLYPHEEPAIIFSDPKVFVKRSHHSFDFVENDGFERLKNETCSEQSVLPLPVWLCTFDSHWSFTCNNVQYLSAKEFSLKNDSLRSVWRNSHL